MQAIVVKYLGPTDTGKSRYKATAQAGSVTVNTDFRHNSADNARLACNALVRKFDWSCATEWIEGYLPDGSWVFVYDDK